jgi:tRNA (guanine37-N1)-methyltransferase
MRIDVITLFPQMFSALNCSITGKAQQMGKLELQIHNLRDYAVDKYRTVDDYPFGGEPGMVLKPEPLRSAILSVTEKRPAHVIFPTPQGNPLSQNRCCELAKMRNIYGRNLLMKKSASENLF